MAAFPLSDSLVPQADSAAWNDSLPERPALQLASVRKEPWPLRRGGPVAGAGDRPQYLSVQHPRRHVPAPLASAAGGATVQHGAGQAGPAGSACPIPTTWTTSGAAREPSEMAVWGSGGALLTVGGNTEMVSSDNVSSNYFSVLGLTPHSGRFFGPADEKYFQTEPPVVLSYHFWRKQFGGDRNILGRRISLNERRFTVVGIAPPNFNGLQWILPADLWMPVEALGPASAVAHGPGERRIQCRNAPAAGRHPRAGRRRAELRGAGAGGGLPGDQPRKASEAFE